jgi:phospholipid/cholesterol/gamma-HCH transport system substrate-binding protein
VFDAKTKDNIKGIVENLNNSTASLQKLLNTENGALAKTLDNANSFTGNLKNNNDKINHVMANLETTTTNLSKLDLQKTLNNLDVTVNDLKSVIGKVNSDTGTLGKLINNDHLYNNLTSTSNKINLLLDDVRVHPKRYINISLIGRKDRSTPLMVPLPDSINSPYTK